MKASTRREVNRIRGFMDMNEEWKEEDSEMERVATTCFEDLFQASPQHLEATDQILEATSRCISEVRNAKLMVPFTRDEIYAVVRSMHPTKAPGPNGMQAIFYQKY